MKKQILFRRWFAVLFLSMAAGAFYFGWSVTRTVRADAMQTDLQLRTVAWALLSYSNANHSMPTTRDDFVGFISAHPGCLRSPRPAGDWPTTMEEAQASGDPEALSAAVSGVSGISGISGVIEVIWPPTGNLTPVLQVRGKPSGIGTIERVNGWLQSWSAASGAKNNLN